MANATGALSQYVGLVVYSGGSSELGRARLSQYFGLCVTGVPKSKYAKLSQYVGLVPYASVPAGPGGAERARASQMLSLVVYGVATLVDERQRSWAFVMDGHWFYVLDLGAQGTFCYDITTKQWCEFQTISHTGWNMRNGIAWDTSMRPIGADSTYPYVWELVPENTLDEGFREIYHEVTGGIPTRNRTFHAVSALRIAASSGYIYADANGLTTPTSFSLKFSDDNGNTWNTSPEDILLREGDYSQDIAWRSLGAFMAPGRIFSIYDTGGLTRIDGADVFIDGFDQEDEAPPQQGGGNG